MSQLSPSSPSLSLASGFIDDGFNSPDMDGDWTRLKEDSFFAPGSPMKSDGFLPASYDIDAVHHASEEEFSADGKKAIPREFLFNSIGGASNECPVCQRNMVCSPSLFHKHVTLCFQANWRRQSRSAKSKNPAKTVSQIRKFASNMDLRLRIGIMESFRRLGQISGIPSASPRSPSLSPKAEASDNYVLQLCYKIQSARALKQMTLPINCHLPGAVASSKKRSKIHTRMATISRSAPIPQAKEVDRDAIALADAAFASEVSTFKPLTLPKVPHFRQLFDEDVHMEGMKALDMSSRETEDHSALYLSDGMLGDVESSFVSSFMNNDPVPILI